MSPPQRKSSLLDSPPGRPASAADLLALLARWDLVEPHQLRQVREVMAPGCADARSLARALLEIDWLSAFQVNQLLAGNGKDLTVGRYHLVERLGESSLGPVYKARHTVMKRLVGLQILREELVSTPGTAERFYEEVQAASRLCHPNLVEMYDAGPVGRSHFVAMEHVDGTPLAALVSTAAPMSVVQAGVCALQVASALKYAADRGLVHHDLRPANILLVPRKADGVSDNSAVLNVGRPDPNQTDLVKVRNLGLSLLKQNVPGSRQQGSSGSSFRILAGAASAATDEWFVAPEQGGRAERADAAANLYSLGAALFFMLTGRGPLQLGDGTTTAAAVDGSRVPLDVLRPDAPADLRCVVARLLAVDRRARFGSATEVIDVLTGIFMPASRPWVSESPARLTDQSSARLGTFPPAPDPASATQVSLTGPTAELPSLAGPNDARWRDSPTEILSRPDGSSGGESQVDLSDPGAVIASVAVTEHFSRCGPVGRASSPAPGGTRGPVLFLAGAGLLMVLAASAGAWWLLGGPGAYPAAEPGIRNAPAATEVVYRKHETRRRTLLETLRANGVPTLDTPWFLLGPFDNANGSGFAKDFGPEHEDRINRGKVYAGKGRRSLKWTPVDEVQPGIVYDLDHFDRDSQFSCVYFANEFIADRETELPVSMGSDDTLTVWMNGEQRLAHHVDRGVKPDDEMITLSVRPGRNFFLAKVCNFKGSWGFYIEPRFPPALESSYVVGRQFRRDFPPAGSR